MKCPYCGSENIKVIDKRTSSDSFRRRRECQDCKERFTTYEQLEDSNLAKVKKRDGSIVRFDKQKITNAIFGAAREVGGSDKKRSEELTEKSIEALKKILQPGEIPSVEQIQDVVENTLIKNEHDKTAKAYIIHRYKHKELRDSRKTFIEVTSTMGEYLERADWRVNENSNVDFSLGGLILYANGKITANYWLNEIYPEEISKAHINGDFHIHDLSMLCGYCAGWSLKQLLLLGFGGVENQVKSVPAKHLDTVIGQIVNFLGTLQNEWAGAQALSSFDTYLAPFVKSDKLSYDEVKQAIQRFLFFIATPSRWGTQCVPVDTEALTDKGWKSYDEITKNHKIATFNLKSNKIEFLNPQHIKSYDFDGHLINLKNRTQDQLVTPKHKVVRQLFNSKKFELIEAEKLSKFKTYIRIPNSSETKSKKEIDENLVELMAWLVSEGSFSEDRKRVSIFQSLKNKNNCERIRKCLSKNNYGWDEVLRKGGFSKVGVIRFRLNQESSRRIRRYINEKKVPEVIKTLSKNQIRLFLETYVLGDGNKEKKGRIRIYTKDDDIRDSIQELCVLSGYGSSINKRENGVYQINLIRNSITNITKISKKRFKGLVWCPTTKNGTFVARRNGKVFITGNTPFINITLDWNPPEDLKDENAIIGGKLAKVKYKDCKKEMDMINKALMECMLEGDASGRVFTFPIPTYNITKDFDWDSENADLLFKMTAKYGIPYFQNFINSSLKPSDVRSMCCRLQLNLKDLRNKTGGLFGAGESTGSIGVVTVNLPRIGFLSETKKEFFERLEKIMNLAKFSLEIKRKFVTKYMDNGLIPYTKRYLGNLNNHFSTIGIVGMNEACLNLLRDPITSKKGRKFALEVLDFMREKIKFYQEESGHIYNLEATPAEGTSYRLAKIDKQKYPKIKTCGNATPYYTNSSQLPVQDNFDIFDALQFQDELQIKYTGGTVFHAFLGEKIADYKVCKQLVKKIAENFHLPYFTISPTFSICKEHGYLKGEQKNCPKCKKETEIYSRVVGYIRPVSRWNKGKQEEYKDRHVFEVPKIGAK